MFFITRKCKICNKQIPDTDGAWVYPDKKLACHSCIPIPETKK